MKNSNRPSVNVAAFHSSLQQGAWEHWYKLMSLLKFTELLWIKDYSYWRDFIKKKSKTNCYCLCPLSHNTDWKREHNVLTHSLTYVCSLSLKAVFFFYHFWTLGYVGFFYSASDPKLDSAQSSDAYTSGCKDWETFCHFFPPRKKHYSTEPKKQRIG